MMAIKIDPNAGLLNRTLLYYNVFLSSYLVTYVFLFLVCDKKIVLSLSHKKPKIYSLSI